MSGGVGAIVQARLSSARLPGKVLLEIGDRPALQHLLDRLRRCPNLDEIVVATSDDSSDRSLAAFCATAGVECFRGSRDDVAGRFAGVLRRSRFRAFVRVNGDSPLLDPQLVARGIELFAEEDCDVVTNVFPRTFPHGQSVEVVRASTFLSAYEEMTDPRDHEHVTRFFYANAERFAIRNFAASVPCESVHLSLDTEDDLEALRAVVAQMRRPPAEYGLDEILDLRAAVVS